MEVIRCNPAWKGSGVSSPRYDDVCIEEEGDTTWYAKLLLVFQYTHWFNPTGVKHAVPQPTLKRKHFAVGVAGGEDLSQPLCATFNLAFIRSYYPDTSCPTRSWQPYVALKFLPMNHLSHHVVPLESVKARVHIVPRSIEDSCTAFFYNHHADILG